MSNENAVAMGATSPVTTHAYWQNGQEEEGEEEEQEYSFQRPSDSRNSSHDGTPQPPHPRQSWAALATSPLTPAVLGSLSY